MLRLGDRGMGDPVRHVTHHVRADRCTQSDLIAGQGRQLRCIGRTSDIAQKTGVQHVIHRTIRQTVCTSQAHRQQRRLHRMARRLTHPEISRRRQRCQHLGETH